MLTLVLNLLLARIPNSERFQRFLTLDFNSRYHPLPSFFTSLVRPVLRIRNAEAPVSGRNRNLFINVIVAKSDVSRILTRAAEVDLFTSRPVDSGQAHRTGLTTCIHNMPSQVERAKVLARIANRHHLTMRSRIERPRHRVSTTTDDFVSLLAYDYCTERSTLQRFRIVHAQLDGLAHRSRMNIFVLIRLDASTTRACLIHLATSAARSPELFRLKIH